MASGSSHDMISLKTSLGRFKSPILRFGSPVLGKYSVLFDFLALNCKTSEAANASCLTLVLLFVVSA